MKKVDLSKFDNSHYHFGKSWEKAVWYMINMLFFKTAIPYPSAFKIFLLKLFGAKVGNSVVMKPNVNIKYPWFLTIGNHCWIGEGVWIDNLAPVTIGNDVCISQGAYLLTGSHDYKKEAFDLIIGEIILEDGVWIGAKSVVCPNVTCKSHSVLSVGGIATNDLEEYSIYQGNPAAFKRTREIK